MIINMKTFGAWKNEYDGVIEADITIADLMAYFDKNKPEDLKNWVDRLYAARMKIDHYIDMINALEIKTQLEVNEE